MMQELKHSYIMLLIHERYFLFLLPLFINNKVERQ